jgi:hypothetical protein
MHAVDAAVGPEIYYNDAALEFFIEMKFPAAGIEPLQS